MKFRCFGLLVVLLAFFGLASTRAHAQESAQRCTSVSDTTQMGEPAIEISNDCSAKVYVFWGWDNSNFTGGHALDPHTTYKVFSANNGGIHYFSCYWPGHAVDEDGNRLQAMTPEQVRRVHSFACAGE